MLFWILVLMFILCNSADNVTGAFNEIDIYNQSIWYTFPIDVQRLIPIITVNSKKSAVIQTFGNILCNRKTFKRVNIFLDFNHSNLNVSCQKTIDL